MTELCNEHSGCLARLGNLENNNQKQWEKIDVVNSKVDRMFTRLNIILGGMVVAVVLLLINIIVEAMSKSPTP